MVEDKKLASTTLQNIYLENREKLNISGVKDVLSFDDQMVILETELGLLTIKGENLRIQKLKMLDVFNLIIFSFLHFANSRAGYLRSSREVSSSSPPQARVCTRWGSPG